jgi:hypothetical protein
VIEVSETYFRASKFGGVKVFKRYKEIWYGLGIGISAWLIDALMHSMQLGEFAWNAFAKELVIGNSAEFPFRVLFVLVSTALGITLWRSNRRACRVRELQAAIGSFNRQIINPLILIVGYSQMLSLREGFPVAHESIQLIDEIQINAQKINEVIKQLPPPCEELETVELYRLDNAHDFDVVRGR